MLQTPAFLQALVLASGVWIPDAECKAQYWGSTLLMVKLKPTRGRVFAACVVLRAPVASGVHHHWDTTLDNILGILSSVAAYADAKSSDHSTRVMLDLASRVLISEGFA